MASGADFLGTDGWRPVHRRRRPARRRAAGSPGDRLLLLGGAFGGLALALLLALPPLYDSTFVFRWALRLLADLDACVPEVFDSSSQPLRTRCEETKRVSRRERPRMRCACLMIESSRTRKGERDHPRGDRVGCVDQFQRNVEKHNETRANGSGEERTAGSGSLLARPPRPRGDALIAPVRARAARPRGIEGRAATCNRRRHAVYWLIRRRPSAPWAYRWIFIRVSRAGEAPGRCASELRERVGLAARRAGDDPLVAAWIGLTAGFLDLGLMILRKRLIGDDFYRLGEHFRWIIPAAVGALRPAARGRAGPARRPATPGDAPPGARRGAAVLRRVPRPVRAAPPGALGVAAAVGRARRPVRLGWSAPAARPSSGSCAGRPRCSSAPCWRSRC